ncbi:MAG: hypothetical protein J6K12_06255 [Clostridia bacterium]|nr:hypothetical protein [Clostridia bacterium]
MIIREDPSNNTLKIWVDNSEKDTYRENNEYINAVLHFRNTHKICVLVGGTQPIVPTISALLDAQTKTVSYS